MTQKPVFEISPIGTNLPDCPDDQKIFSSEFETLKIAHREVTTGSGYYEHGLGYTPGFIVSNGQFDDSDIWGFVGQYPSPSYFEIPFIADSTYFYYWTVCKFFLFYQSVEI